MTKHGDKPLAKNPGIKFEEWLVAKLDPYFGDARRTKASGATWGTGDVLAGPLEIEAKDRPSQKSVSITQTVLERNEEAARNSGRTPLMANRCQAGTYITMRWEDYEIMLDRLIKLEEQIDQMHKDAAGECI
jgi:hypothetical protein